MIQTPASSWPRKNKMLTRLVALGLTLMPEFILAGPYPPASGKNGSTAVPRDDLRIKGWATGVASFQRGPMDISDPSIGFASYGTAITALGLADVGEPEMQPEPGTPGPFQVVSLGDGGFITLSFSPPIADHDGPDFAVFENGFRDNFLELAFVEVSSDGVSFFRFPAVSLTQNTTQIGNGGALDPTNLHNLAGKYRARFGTPFDLAELADSPAHTDLDVQHITHVRIIDVVGCIDPQYASLDSLGNIINDPWPTVFESGGFDLDAVAVLNQAPIGMTYALWVEQWDWAQRPSGPDEDADGDGVNNLLEYAFATSPIVPSAEPEIVLIKNEETVTATFPQIRSDATDLRARIEISPDLHLWATRSGLNPAELPSSHFCRIVIELTSTP